MTEIEVVKRLNKILSSIELFADERFLIDTVKSCGEIYVAGEINGTKKEIENLISDFQNKENDVKE